MDEFGLKIFRCNVLRTKDSKHHAKSALEGCLKECIVLIQRDRKRKAASYHTAGQVCQSEVSAVGSLRLCGISSFDVVLLRDDTVIQQPLGRTHCGCDLPGLRLPEGLLTLWGVVSGHVYHPHGQKNQAH